MDNLMLEHNGNLYVPQDAPEVSLPIGIHCGVTKHYENAISQVTLELWHSIEPMSSRRQATHEYAALLVAFQNHSDWLQLQWFFIQRYVGLKLRNRSSRKMKPLATREETRSMLGKGAERAITLDVNTQPEEVGLPADLLSRLREVHRICTDGMVAMFRQPDQVTRAFGPAISIAVGPYIYMNMLYNRNVPAYASEGTLTERLNPLSDPGYEPAPSEQRTIEHWRLLFRAFADWVYECDAQLMQKGAYYDGGILHHDWLSDDEVHTFFNSRSKRPRKWLRSPAIDVADAMRDLVDELFERPVMFQGREWDYLESELHPEYYDAFLARFGPRSSKQSNYAEHLRYVRNELTKDVSIDMTNLQNLVASSQGTMRIRTCPESTDGMEWDKWIQEILATNNDGLIIAPKTAFQALWTSILLSFSKIRWKIMKGEDLASQDIRKTRKDTVYVV